MGVSGFTAYKRSSQVLPYNILQLHISNLPAVTVFGIVVCELVEEESSVPVGETIKQTTMITM